MLKGKGNRFNDLRSLRQNSLMVLVHKVRQELISKRRSLVVVDDGEGLDPRRQSLVKVSAQLGTVDAQDLGNSSAYILGSMNIILRACLGNVYNVEQVLEGTKADLSRAGATVLGSDTNTVGSSLSDRGVTRDKAIDQTGKESILKSPGLRTSKLNKVVNDTQSPVNLTRVTSKGNSSRWGEGGLGIQGKTQHEKT